MNDPYVQYMYSYPHKLAYEKLCGIDLRQEANALLRGENSLYFHIPFCQYKCGYCNLFSLAGKSERQMEAYVDAMQRHAEQLSGILPKDAVFSDFTLGGGTPLILPEHLLRRVFSIARDFFWDRTKKTGGCGGNFPEPDDGRKTFYFEGGGRKPD